MENSDQPRKGNLEESPRDLNVISSKKSRPSSCDISSLQDYNVKLQKSEEFESTEKEDYDNLSSSYSCSRRSIQSAGEDDEVDLNFDMFLSNCLGEEDDNAYLRKLQVKPAEALTIPTVICPSLHSCIYNSLHLFYLYIMDLNCLSINVHVTVGSGDCSAC